uniref:Uncharacterized protein n=1 Tax=Globodera rostochiensis TaxID=31243 RepID=A0A914I738_GLORO
MLVSLNEPVKTNLGKSEWLRAAPTQDDVGTEISAELITGERKGKGKVEQRMHFPRQEMKTDDPCAPTLGFAHRSMAWDVGGDHPGVIPVLRGRVCEGDF